MPEHDVLLGYLDGDTVSTSFDSCKMRLIARDMYRSKRLKKWAEIRTHSLGIPVSRNNLARQLLDDSDLQWLFMVDSDMGFAEDTLDQMLASADPETRPVIGALCFSQREVQPDGMGGFVTFGAPVILQWTEHTDGIHRFTGVDHYPVNALVRAGATGGACILIHRSALERIRDVFGETWFDQTSDGGGDMQSEDISFCERLFKLNIPLYVDTGVRTTHYKGQWMSEQDFWLHRLCPPAEETVDVIVPALHHPQNVPTLMRSLRASTGLAAAWFVCDPHDKEEQAAVRRFGGEVLQYAGSFAKKVNHAVRRTKAPWVFLCSDDARFRPAWLDQALDVARRYKAQVIGVNDLTNSRVSYMLLISRRYIAEQGASWDGPGSTCHEGYNHWYVDDEIVAAAQMRGVFQPALGSQVEHLRSRAGRVQTDDVSRLGEVEINEDRTRFESRLRKVSAPLSVEDEQSVMTDVIRQAAEEFVEA